MNLSKLAQIANVSVSTVSKAFSDSNEISIQTKEHIFEIAKEYGCFDKYYKPKYSKKVISVICPEMLGIHYTQMATFLDNEISGNGGTMVLSVSDFSIEKQDELIDYYTRFSCVDGIIIIEPTGIIKNNTDIPIVQIGLDNESKNVDCVNVDAGEAMNAALKHLISNNCNKIGFIGEKYAQQEYNYFKSAMNRLSLSVDEKYVSISDMRFYDAGYYGISRFIDNENIPDAIFAAYSHIAVGLLQRLKEEGIQVPEDISVICMDDISSVPYSDINLACIKMHLDDVCATALDLLYRKIEKRYIKAKRSVTISREFKKGETVI